MNSLLRLNSNPIGRDFIIGDLHGCYDELLKQMDTVSFDKTNDRMFSVGDLIDRGPDSEKCLELLSEPWFYSVLGNHEEFLLEYMGTGQAAVWYNNGGGWFFDLPRSRQRELYTLIKENMPLVITVGNRFNILHAESFTYDQEELVGNEKRIEAYRATFLWSRSIWQKRAYLSDDAYIGTLLPTFCGHTPFTDVVTFRNHMNLDTGACFNGGKLTMKEITNV